MLRDIHRFESPETGNSLDRSVPSPAQRFEARQIRVAATSALGLFGNVFEMRLVAAPNRHRQGANNAMMMFFGVPRRSIFF